MAYLRKRRIGSGTYYYVVESRWISGKIRQKILEYLGRDPDPKRLKRACKYWGVRTVPLGTVRTIKVSSKNEGKRQR